MKKFFYFVIVLGLLVSNIAIADTEMKTRVRYKLSSFFGIPYSLEVVAPWSQDDVTRYLQLDSLSEGIDGLGKKEKYSRAIQMLHQAAYDLRIPTYRYSLAYSRREPYLSGYKTDMDKLMPRLEKIGFSFENLTEDNPRRHRINEDLRGQLETYQSLTEKLINQLMTGVLGLSEVKDGSLTYAVLPKEALQHLYSIDLAPIFETVNEFNIRDHIDFPERLFSDRQVIGEKPSINLAQMTTAEMAWYKSLSSLQYSMKILIEKLHGIKANKLEAVANRATLMENLVNQVFDRVAESEDNVGDLAKKQDRLKKNLQDAGSSLISSFYFEARHIQRSWHKINPNILMPLYSFGLLAATQYYEGLPHFDQNDYANLAFEHSYRNVLSEYIAEEVMLDIYTEAVFIHIVQNNGLHSLLRLSAFSLLAKHHGIEKTALITGVDKKAWKKLYTETEERVTLSPNYNQHAYFVPHIDYEKNSKVAVDKFFDVIEDVRIELGVTAIELPSRFEVRATNLPDKFSESRGEALLKYFRTREAPKAVDHPAQNQQYRKVEQGDVPRSNTKNNGDGDNAIDFESRKKRKACDGALDPDSN